MALSCSTLQQHVSSESLTAPVATLVSRSTTQDGTLHSPSVPWLSVPGSHVTTSEVPCGITNSCHWNHAALHPQHLLHFALAYSSQFLHSTEGSPLASYVTAPLHLLPQQSGASMPASLCCRLECVSRQELPSVCAECLCKSFLFPAT